MKKTKLNKLSGFTLDQTILVVAVIAILATIIISSVAWNVLNRANATKLNAHFEQIGAAIGQFYQDNDFEWPADAQDLSPYLAGYNTSGSTDLTTPFGSSSATSVLSITDGNTTGQRLSTGSSCTSSVVDCYTVVRMTNVQVQELKKANDAMDGKNEGNSASTNGRLRWTGGSGAADSDRVTATYYAVKLYK